MEPSTTAEPPDGANPFHSMWAAVAPSWAEHAEYVDARGALVAGRLLEFSAPQPGERVLELACGPGGVGLAAAPLVGPAGEVVLSDAVAEMTAIAAARANSLGLANVSTRVLDLERIDEPDASYDVALCRDGLMFTLDPARAVGEIGRVLRPGGRVAIAVWGPRERNPWLAVLLDAVGAQLGAPVPPPGIRGPFALDDAEKLAGLFADAPFEAVAVEELLTPLHADSFDDWWTRTLALAGPLTTMLEALPEDAVSAIRARAQEAVGAYESQGGIDLPGVNLLATGRRVV